MMEQSKDDGDVSNSSEDSCSYDATTHFAASVASDESRDEVKEVEKATRAETNRLRLWRIVVTVVLLLTALAVTLTTYKLLQHQEHKSFETAVSKLGRSFGCLAAPSVCD